MAGHRTGENPARWDGHLEHLLAPRKKVRKGQKQPALPWEQIPEFVAELRALPGIAPRALEFAILTAARSGEVRGMQWSELAGDVWTVPGSRMKGGAEHRVPLTPRVRAILAGDFVNRAAKAGDQQAIEVLKSGILETRI